MFIFQSRYEQMSAEYNAQLTELTSEVASFRKTSDEVNAYVRKLEQKNDDLERTNRYVVWEQHTLLFCSYLWHVTKDAIILMHSTY